MFPKKIKLIPAKASNSVSSDYQSPSPGPDQQNRQPNSEQWGSWESTGEDEQQRHAVAGTRFTKPVDLGPSIGPDPQFTHREHVSGSLASNPSEAPLFRPAYPAYPGNRMPSSGYPPQAPGYPPFAGYPPQSPGYPPYPGYPSYKGYTSPPPGYTPQAAPQYVPMNNG